MRTRLQGATFLAALLGAGEAGATPTLTGRWVQNNSSVKIQVTSAAPAGALDYRVCADNDWNGSTCTGTVKYAGRLPGNGTNDTTSVPNTEVEWQFSDANAHLLYIEAVDHLGPVPKYNLIDFAADALLYTPVACNQTSIAGANYGCSVNGGMIAINGQGDYNNNPKQIPNAWAAITVSASPATVPLPSSSLLVPNVIQVVYDSFDASENLSTLMYQAGQQYQPYPLMQAPTDGTLANGQWGVTNYTVNGQAVPWDIEYSAANVDTGQGDPSSLVSFTQPFFRENAFEDILVSGPNTAWEDGESLPPHNKAWDDQRNERYASMALTPKVAADLSNNKMLHVTFEVDAEFFQGNRWASVVIAPASDPVASFRFDDLVPSTAANVAALGPTQFGLQAPNRGHNTTTPANNPNSSGLNASNQALWVQFLQLGCDAALFSGTNNPNGNNGDGDAIASGAVNFIAEDYASDLNASYSSSVWKPPAGCTPSMVGTTEGCCPTSSCWIEPQGPGGATNGVPTAGCYPAAFCTFPGYFQSTANRTWPAANVQTVPYGNKGYYTAPTWPGLKPNAKSCLRGAGTGQAGTNNGRGLDSRSRFDVFLSAGNAATNTYAHLWLFEDGAYLADSTVMLGGQGGTPVALPFTQAKVYFVHYAYAIDDGDEAQNLPAAMGQPQPELTGALGPNAYWQAVAPATAGCTAIAQACTTNGQCCSGVCNTQGACAETAISHGEPLSTAANPQSQNGSFPYSDHRHWDNLGFEVLPTNFSTQAVAQLPAYGNVQALIATATSTSFQSTH